MKILFLSALLPYPLVSGGQIRMFHLLKRLAKSHEITLLSFIRDMAEVSTAEKLDFCWKVLVAWRGRAWQPRYIISAVLSRYSWLLSTYNNTFMRSLIESEVSQTKYDLVHIEPFYIYPSLPALKLPLVVGEHNIEYRVYEEYARRSPLVLLRPLMYADVVKLRRWEERVWRSADQITTVSEDDRQIIAAKTKATVTVVPNGVDLQTFPFQPRESKIQAPTLLFVGNFAWVPNQEGVKKLLTTIWPKVQEALPQARLRIVGRGVSPGLVRLAENQGAEVVGEVPEILPEYRKADILVSPVEIAGGTKFKILEAMAVGLPVVASSQAVAGLLVKDGTHVLIAHEPASWVAQIRKIWENKKHWDKLTKAARRLVVESYSWDTIADRLDGVWRRTHEQATD